VKRQAHLLVGFALLSLAAACQRTTTPVLPEQEAADASLSTNRIHLGDPIQLQARVRHEPGQRVVWPEPARARAIVVRNNPPPRDDTGRLAAKTWEITSLEIGTHAVFTNGATLVAADGTSSGVPMPELTLRVDSLLAGTTNTALRDLKALARWPRPGLHSAFLMLAAVAGAAALIALAVLLLRRRRAHPAPSVETPPHERALQALARLRASGWVESGDVQAFYVELSAIVRRYLEERFGLRAPEQTTEEFIRSASTSRLLTLEHQLSVTQFLEQSDLVKFARHQPTADDMQAALQAAERLVRETIPQAPAPPPLPARAAEAAR
jgi:hypothetical protein